MKARAARMSKTELSEAGRKAASAPRKCECGHARSTHDDGGETMCLWFDEQSSVWCQCHAFTPLPSRRKAKVGT